MNLDGETTLTHREEGFLVGILAGEGHFGGDGKQPQVTLRMDIKHEDLFFWLRDRIPGSKLYGPYHHGGRSYYQWMVRGESLRQVVIPILARNLDLIDSHVRGRIATMTLRYGLTFPELGVQVPKPGC